MKSVIFERSIIIGTMRTCLKHHQSTREVVYVRVFAMKLQAISEILFNATANDAGKPMEQHLPQMLQLKVQILKLLKVKT